MADKATNLGRQGLESARHSALVENTAQAIFWEIQELENNRQISEQRWVWELLQNALDATPQGKPTLVRITWDKTELIFEHNGDAFTSDELAHLVYHGSTKYDDPTKRGKFGRGFLVTHLLSKKVSVSGLGRDADGVFSFNMELDRSGDADDVKQQMDVTWGQIVNSRKLLSAATSKMGEFNTRYVYRPDSTERQVVVLGMESAMRCLAWVLACTPELEDVSLGKPGVSISWRKERVWSDTSDNTLSFTRVHCQKTVLIANGAAQPHDQRFTIVAKQVERNDDQDSVSVGLMLKASQTPEIVADDSVPRFFAEGLPIIGTENIPMPFTIHSSKFEVESDRTGLHLEGVGTVQQKNNWALLSKVPDLCCALLKYSSRENWHGLHLLANIKECPHKDWLDSDHFTKSVLQNVAHRILTDSQIRLVQTTRGDHVSIKDAVVPCDDPEGKLFDLLSTWKPAKQGLVDRDLSAFWSGVLVNLAKVASADIKQLTAAWFIEHLALKISACGNLKALGENVQLEQGEGTIDWLNRFISLTIASSNVHLLIFHTLLPNQHGNLCKQSELSHDPGVDDELKDIAMSAGIDERSKFLDKRVEGLGEKLKDRTELEVLNTLLGIVTKLQPGQNAKLLAWLARRPSYLERINSYPVMTLGSTQTLDKNRALLKPVAKWSEDSAAFSDLFPKDFTLAEVYAQHLTDECWKVLEGNGFVHTSVIYMRDEKDIDKCIQELPTEEEGQAVEHKVSIKVTDIAFLEEKDKGVIDTVRHSQIRARKFVQFVFNYLLQSDRSWMDAVSVSCSCKKDHKIFACGWLSTLKDRQWIPLPSKKYGFPTAENIASLLDQPLLFKLAEDDDSVTFLQRLGIGVSDLFSVKIADPKERLRADRLAARMYAQDAQTRVMLSQILDDPDMLELATKHLEEKKLAKRNRDVGAKVEKLIKQALETEHISVQRTGIGSDYELEYDFIENGQEQGLVVGKYLLEVKSTSAESVRMTLSQGNNAANPPSKYVGYILCVCPVNSDIVTEDDIKIGAHFMFDISSAIKEALDSGNALQNMESTLKGTGDHGVRLELGQSPKRLRVSRDAWIHGVDFNSAVSQLKHLAGGTDTTH